MHMHSLKLLCPMIWDEMHLQENLIYDLDLGVKYPLHNVNLGVKVTQNVSQYSLHHVTYAAAKFEATAANGLGGDKFTRTFIV